MKSKTIIRNVLPRLTMFWGLILSVSWPLILSNCAQPEVSKQKPRPQTAEPKTQPSRILRRTKTSNARRKQLSKDYHDTVNLSIWDLDDGVTSPEIIARAALSRGAERYRAWKRVTVVEDLDLTQYERGQLEELLSDFPDRQTVDLWTGFVLERRRRGGDLLPEGRKRLKELGIN